MWGVVLKSFAMALSIGGVTPAADDCTDPSCCGKLFCPPPGSNGGVVYKQDKDDTLENKFGRKPIGSSDPFGPFNQDFYYAPDDRLVVE